MNYLEFYNNCKKLILQLPNKTSKKRIVNFEEELKTLCKNNAIQKKQGTNNVVQYQNDLFTIQVYYSNKCLNVKEKFNI
jgi:hypothetical protein